MALTKTCVYGGMGFIGGVYRKMFPESLLQEHDEIEPQSNEILYFISTTDNYNVFTNPLLDILTNEVLLIKVLEAARKKYGNLFTFSFISSWFVYGAVDLPAKEDACCNPKGFYSISKRAAEQYLISYCETYGIHYRILRLANVIGVEDDRVSAKKNALQYLIKRIADGESIQLYNGGNFTRDYINVRDACLGIYIAMTKGIVDTIYNISNGLPLKFRDLIDIAVKEAGGTPEISDMPPSDFHTVVQVKDMVLDNTKLKELGYRPRYSMEATIRQIVNYYNGNRQR